MSMHWIWMHGANRILLGMQFVGKIVARVAVGSNTPDSQISDVDARAKSRKTFISIIRIYPSHVLRLLGNLPVSECRLSAWQRKVTDVLPSSRLKLGFKGGAKLRIGSSP
jgi:hypothetical protein